MQLYDDGGFEFADQLKPFQIALFAHVWKEESNWIELCF